MIVSADLQKGLQRLVGQRDFVLFIQALDAERSTVIDSLIATKDPVIVHQLQGSAQTLKDILQAATSAAPVLA